MSGRHLSGGAVRRAVSVLYISSPIGLGYAQRDRAIADEPRKLTPTSRSQLALSRTSRTVPAWHGQGRFTALGCLCSGPCQA